MAWPCISRVCCLARFWNQLDKSDLSVPLTTHNYSDISEQQEKAVAVRSVTKPEPRTRGPSPRDGGCRAASCKPREDYRPPGEPFPSLTQYKQDFKPWPIPRKDNFPWISNGGADAPLNSHRREEKGRRCGGEEEEEGKTSSYRHEFRPWTGARPAKSARKTPPAQYCSPGTTSSLVSRETSYQAAFSAELSRSTSHSQQDAIPSAASNVHPTAVPQPSQATLHTRGASLHSSIQQNILPSDGLDLGHKTEEHLVRTKLPPNPSAVFQSGPRVFNI